MKKRIAPLRVNRLFLKILSCFLSLLIPIVAVGFFTYTNFVKELKRDFEEKIMMNLQISSNAIDENLQMIYESSFGFFNDPAVIRLLKPDSLYTTAERAELDQLSRSIARAHVNISGFVDEMFVYIDDRKIYTSSGANDFDPFLGKYYRFADYDASVWKSMMKSGKTIDIFHPTDVETPFARKRMIPILTLEMIGANRAVMVTTVPVATIQQRMDAVFASASTRVVVTDKDGQYLLTTDAGFANAEALRAVGELSGLPKQGEYAVGGKTYTISALSTKLYGWNFYAITPIDEFNKQASGILDMVVIICVILMVIGFIFSFIFAYYIYNPIRRIGESLSDGSEGGREEVESARSNDWERIGRGINQLIERRRQAQDELELLSMEYMDNVIVQLLQGSELSTAQNGAVRSMMASQLGFDKPSFVSCAITIEFRGDYFTDFQDVERILIQSKLKKMIILLLGDPAMYVLEYKPHLYVVVANIAEGKDVAGIERKLRQMMQTFRYDAVYCRINAGIGDVYEGPEGINRSYRDALTALLGAKPNDNFLTIRAEELPIQRNVPYTFFDETRLLNAIKAGDADGLAAMIGEMLRELDERHVSFDDRNALLYEMYNTGRRFLMERGLQPDQFATEPEHRQLSGRGEDPAALDARRRLLLDFFRRIAALMAKKQSHKSGSLVALIQSYVEEHYTSDLSLEKIAEEMDISVKYASRVFKDKIGVNLTDYISQLRIAKAKELLLHTNRSIQDITEQVGYFSRTTFLRTFKRMEGVSPQEFRKTGELRTVREDKKPDRPDEADDRGEVRFEEE
ncbi:helix-turn-helix domain-containing protein [Paenibacillus cymbidii]|uniref:helix-turn-helix domain-containing protein n=1 Tax=Paenibacillus cymbidii TaxID=1639034 RepID=UPI001436C114|nr:helix-turn-helix domain-containing protein [Paenibacillus cymbidii]